jgi:hypothetical protein
VLENIGSTVELRKHGAFKQTTTTNLRTGCWSLVQAEISDFLGDYERCLNWPMLCLTFALTTMSRTTLGEMKNSSRSWHSSWIRKMTGLSVICSQLDAARELALQGDYGSSMVYMEGVVSQLKR